MNSSRRVIIWLFAIILLRKSQPLTASDDKRSDESYRDYSESSNTKDPHQMYEYFDDTTASDSSMQSDFESSQTSKNPLEFEEVQNAFRVAEDLLHEKDMFDENLIKNDIFLNNSASPGFKHSQFNKAKSEAILRSRIALAQELATLAIIDGQSGSSSGRKKRQAPTNNGGNTVVSAFTPCTPIPICNSNDDIYRRYDGSCNNRNEGKTLWGSAFTPFERMVSPPNYQDGIREPRVSVTGDPLPSARLISSTIISDKSKQSSKYTLSVMQWGQFIDHDLTQTPIFELTNEFGPSYGGPSEIQCCTSDGLHLNLSSLHSECFPIDIPVNDPFYSQFGQQCMNFVRSLPAPSVDCTLGFRNQMNQISHFLDGSVVYGSSDNEAFSLRTFYYGQLQVNHNFNNLLPDDFTTNEFDFHAGDSRVNEQPQLSVIQTLWVRQHNKVANILSEVKFHWQNYDEIIFQETRRIIIAQIQHIVFNEWLPIILGKTTMKKFLLEPKTSGFLSSSSSSSSNKDPRILNEFAAAAFRFGHTLIQGNIDLYGVSGHAGSLSLSDNFVNPALLTSVKTFDHLLKGLFNQPMQNFDQCVPDDLTNKLFMTTEPFGLDLVALNIQRGRDQGIGTYSQLRDLCSMTPAIEFESLIEEIDVTILNKLESVYNGQVEDIDAYIAGISEKPVKDGVLGPLFNCIVSKQFFNLKYGDRFYYEKGDLPSSFQLDELDEIRKTTWARIVCDNGNNIRKIQPQAFKLPDNALNAIVSCNDSSKIPAVNYNVFNEQTNYY